MTGICKQFENALFSLSDFFAGENFFFFLLFQIIFEKSENLYTHKKKYIIGSIYQFYYNFNIKQNVRFKGMKMNELLHISYEGSKQFVTIVFNNELIKLIK